MKRQETVFLFVMRTLKIYFLNIPKNVNIVVLYIISLKVKVLVTQLCLILCNFMDCSPKVSSVHRILQARILEWVAIVYI